MSVPDGVKFGVRIHQGGYDYQELRRVWQEADRLGFYSATLYDLLNTSTLECWTTLAALAAETRRIRLVPLVLANLYRHPAVLAKMAATLDVISGGRLELGLGAGGDEADHVASGIPFPSTPERVAMLGEAVEVIKRLWSGSPVSYQGRHYQLRDAVCSPAPLQTPGPPILIGGHGETHLLRVAAAHSDICNMRFDMSLDDHRRARDVLEAHCRTAGRDVSEIEISHNANVIVAESDAALEEVLSRQAAARGMALDDYRKTLANAIVGTPERCVAQIRRYVDGGIRYFFLLFPHPVDVELLRLFAATVMPRFPSAVR